jgi:mannose-6-phosphate isomerase
MELLRGQIRDYAWGSREGIARIQNRPVPSDGPEAELWLGAHPGAPSTLLRDPGGVSLADAINADPAGMLGAEVAGAGARLPYLLKLLAAGDPLSLQAHPDAEQARAGYAAEQAAGTQANYVDPYPKPELLVAVEDFDALCGFRDPEASAAALESLAVEALKPVIDALRTGTEAQRLRGAVELIMSWPVADRPAVITAVTESGRAGQSAAHRLAAHLGTRYPGDVGVLAALLLNQVRLRPDEAAWMPAGNMHAYLNGVAVEIMGASDNVLRGGLTPKRVDAAELLRVLRFEVLADPVLRPVPLGPGLVTWQIPAREFALCKAVLTDPAADLAAEPAADSAAEPVTLPAGGPRIVFCLRGQAELRVGDQRLTLDAGASAFVAGTEPAVTCSGTAELFQASTP